MRLKRWSWLGVGTLIGSLLIGSPPASARGSHSPASLQLIGASSSRSGTVASLISSARHSIRVEVYLLTNTTVIDELARAKARGITVRVLLEQHPYGAEGLAQVAYRFLRLRGINVRWANESAFTYTHEKAMVIDGQVAGIFTFNLTSAGLYDNREFGIIDRRRADAATLAAIFDADWNRRAPHVTLGDLVISPYNSRAALDSIIDGAHRTLDLYQEEMDDLGIEMHLERAVQRHVRVRLIISQSSAGVDALRSAGVEVKIVSSPYIHAKAIVADGSRIFVGSENSSNTSLDHNREAGILTTNRRLAASIEATFNGDWSGGGSPPPPPPSSTHSGPFSVRVSVSPASVHRGQLLTITASTKPGARCSVRVTYPDGYVSRSRELARVEVVGSGGSASWSYHEGSTVSGTAQAAVTCTLSSSTSSAGTSFSIS